MIRCGPSNRSERFQDGIVSRTETRQQRLRRIPLQFGHGEKHVLGGDVFVLEGIRFFKRFFQKLVDLR